jgi:aspartyl-tRNA(Asn)/glutamyl-tRNA(Gln) amidotransferase subunit A
MSGDLAGLTLAQAAEAVRERRVSPVELTDACLEHIQAVEPRINAFIAVTAESAREAARQAADEIAGGNYRGPLHGIPLALKDIIDVQGVPTTAASKVRAGALPATRDGAVTERLDGAGAIVLGKLNLHEFAFGATGARSAFGPARNPWGTDRATGGSSSGSGASVAAGECFAAIGTDTGGSIRIPASLCGVVGLKPTFGRVSRRGVVPLSWSLDHLGPLARTVEDAAIVYQAVAGHDPEDASSSDQPVGDVMAGLRDGVKGLRIGLPDNFFFDALDADVEAAVGEAIQVLEGLGSTVGPVTLPLADELPAAVNAIMLPEALAYHHRTLKERADDYDPDVRYRLELGATFLAVHYVQAQRLREVAVGAWRSEVFDRFDIIATATTQTPAPPLDASDLGVTLGLIRLTNPINLLGLPAVSVPCGFTSQGLPIGFQLIGPWFREDVVLRAAHAYEQATEWHAKRPRL